MTKTKKKPANWHIREWELKKKKVQSLNKKVDDLKKGFRKIIESEVKQLGGAKTLSRALGKEESYVRKSLERGTVAGMGSLVNDLAELGGYGS